MMMKFPENFHRNREEFDMAVGKSIANFPGEVEASYQLSGLFILLPLWFHSISNKNEVTRVFEKRSAYLIYHWESFSTIENSFYLALASQYSNAYILLRATLETLIRGAFCEGLTHKEYRENVDFKDLKTDKKAKRFFKLIRTLMEEDSNIDTELETLSVGIYDLIGPLSNHHKFQPSFKTIVKQIQKWGFLRGLDNPMEIIYQNHYAFLSKNVHVIPDMTDIGRALINESTNPYQLTIFSSSYLKQYLHEFNQIIDIGILLVVNIMSKNLRIDTVRQKVLTEVMRKDFQRLPLDFSKKRLTELLKLESYNSG